MNEAVFKELSKMFAPMITTIIESNVKYYRFCKKIRWTFGHNENSKIYAWVGRKDDTVYINLAALLDSLNDRQPHTIEYFILHEIRHLFQHNEINDYTANNDCVVSKDLIEKWIYEGEHYVTAIDSNGNENADYFTQDSEMDAYAFAFAVMKHKYGNIDYLYVPESYSEDFYTLVNDWLEQFNKENL